MNTDLREFIGHYLSIVFSTLLMVGFCAFLAIPFHLGGHPGEEPVAHNHVQAPLPQSEAPQQG